MPIALDSNPTRDDQMDDPVDELAMKIFTQMAAQHAVRHGVHDARAQASSLVRESFKLAEAFMQERHARMSKDKTRA
jgi:hypothetical protein